MPNLLQRGATWLGTKLQTTGGRTVIYRRGQFSVELVVSPVQHDEPVDATEWIGTKVRRCTFAVASSELLLNGELTVPRDGDMIEETLHDRDVKWQVLPKEDTLPCYEWMDSTGILFAVHAKQVE